MRPLHALGALVLGLSAANVFHALTTRRLRYARDIGIVELDPPLLDTARGSPFGGASVRDSDAAAREAAAFPTSDASDRGDRGDALDAAPFVTISWDEVGGLRTLGSGEAIVFHVVRE
jgi:hypothetical protein